MYGPEVLNQPGAMAAQGCDPKALPLLPTGQYHSLARSNWTPSLDTPPYGSFPVACGIAFTFGGVTPTPERASITKSGRSIPGLTWRARWSVGFAALGSCGRSSPETRAESEMTTHG